MIGSRGFDFLSCRAYGNSGTTAVTRLAEPRCAASTMISSSIRKSFTDMPLAGANDCTRNTSAPRMDSS